MVASQPISSIGCFGAKAGAAAASLFFRLPFYGATLTGRVPRAIRPHAPDPWPGDANTGSAIVGGRFALGGELVAGDLAVWNGEGGPAWAESFHGFEWLRDLQALGGDAAHQRARKLVKDWMAANEKWSALVWRGDVLGRRLASWIAHYDFIAGGADAAFRTQVLTSLARQTRHLARVVPGALSGAALLSALKGLVLGGLALSGFERMLERAIGELAFQLTRQILADGGHMERSPSLQLGILRDLVDLRGALIAAQQPMPDELLHAIDRMAPMLRFFRMGDGGLALFNGGSEEQPWFVDLVLARTEAKGKPLAAAPHSGFQRLNAGRTTIVADSGVPVRLCRAQGIPDRAHAGTLSFEMSAGKDRVIVNCGAHPARNAAWSRAARATAAHSTLVIEDTNSADVTASGLSKGPRVVTCTRKETDDGIAIEAMHDGYAALFGLAHRRRLLLAHSGGELRGEDTLIALAGGRRKRPERKFAIRFHLHPDAKASLTHDGRGVLVKLGSGAGARFSASGGEVAIEDSVYLGNGELRRSQQIVVSGVAEPLPEGDAATVTWVLSKIGEKS